MKPLNTGKLFLVALFGMLILMHACRKDDPTSRADARLEFSTDTVLFDTVFTQLGGGPNPRSVNKRFTIRNPYDQPLRTDIRLAGGSASPFRINVDGIPQLSVEGYEIRPKDSAYIFVEVTVDQNNSNNPLIVQDSIEFMTNGNFQNVKLVAWGQDAHYINAATLCDEVWDDQLKPYVIYNSAYVDIGCRLTIEAGVKVHAAVNSRLYVGGTLNVNGTKDLPVVFQGARLGADFEDLPSQWWGIQILPSARDNTITYATIKNGVIGIEVDSLQSGGGTKLRLENSIIKNMSAGGLICYTARVWAQNVLSTNCGQYTFLGELGGNYTLRHCTFAMYNTTFSHTKPAFGLSNANYTDPDGNVTINDLTYTIQNCIIYGNLDEELVFYTKGQGNRTESFQNCLVKTELNTLPGNSSGNLFNQDPLFTDISELTFELEDSSPAIDAGLTNLFPQVTTDLRGEARDVPPDIGAYERIK